MKNSSNLQTKNLADIPMTKFTKAASALRLKHLTLPVIISSLMLTGCGGGSPVSDGGTPVKPEDYYVDSVDEIANIAASYAFEGEYGLDDESGNSLDAETTGRFANLSGSGALSLDSLNGIHALSQAAVFDGTSGLLLPGDLIVGQAFTVSMWVKPAEVEPPEGSVAGPYFYMESPEGNTLTFDDSGLTVSGETGFGRAGDEPFTYKGNFSPITRDVWTHIAFSVDEAGVDIYVDGENVYEAGDALNGGTKFVYKDENDIIVEEWFMEKDRFDDMFSGRFNTIAVGVSNDPDTVPFEGLVDELRIFSTAVYRSNIMTLAAQAEDEKPQVELAAELSGSDQIVLNWTVGGFVPASIDVVREKLGDSGTVTLTDGAPLEGSITTYTDAPSFEGRGGAFRYLLEISDEAGRLVETDYSEAIYVEGTDPYVAVTAELIAAEQDIELTFETKNITIGSVRVLRSTTSNVGDAREIATGVTTNTYIDLDDDDSLLLAGTTYYYWAEITDADTAVVTTSFTLPSASATAGGVFVPPGQLMLGEDDDGFCGSDTAGGNADEFGIEDVNGGFDGTGYINTVNAVGASAYYKINVAAAGFYSFSYRYAYGNADNRSATLKLSDGTVLASMTGAGTGAFTTYDTIDINQVELPEGELDIVVEAVTAGGLVNLDWIRFDATETGVGPTGVECK